MINKEYRTKLMSRFREDAPGPDETDLNHLGTPALVSGCFHALEREYDVSELAERDTIRKRHLEALALALWYELHADLEHPDDDEDVLRIIDDRLNRDS